MIKVLIADDEEKVCLLIKKLINWEYLDMQSIAIAHNGIEALSLIEQYRPDIVITDIQMPGCDGLEMIEKAKQLNEEVKFIIISGYRHFEYAQKALKYGVCDYLLKPIKKEELNSTLLKMKNTYDAQKEKSISQEQIMFHLEQGIQKIRSGIFTEYIFKLTGDMLKLPMKTLNEQYHFQFQEGCYQVIIVKLDGNGYITQESTLFIKDKVTNVMTDNFKKVCYELEVFIEDGFIYCLLNYSHEQKTDIRKRLRNALNDLLLQKSMFEHLCVTLGVGNITSDIKQLRKSLESARWACEQRLILGTEKIIDQEEKIIANLAEDPMFIECNRDMEMIFDRMDLHKVKPALHILKESLLGMKGISGHEILQMTKEICNLYLFALRKNNMVPTDDDHFLERYSRSADDYSGVDRLFRCLENTIAESMEKILTEKEQEDTRPIRISKKYIQEHYMNSITLEEVSGIAGFNPTYFSSIFKKETGDTFLEYLTRIRMEKAKELLKSTRDNVASICEQVGYQDIKSFNRVFIKHTGLKPNQYRKLYS